MWVLQQEKFEEVFGTKVGIPAANKTRWNSVFRQVQSVLKRGFTELNSVARTTKNMALLFSTRDWEQLIELCEILDPFAEYTDLLQGEEVSVY